MTPEKRERPDSQMGRIERIGDLSQSFDKMLEFQDAASAFQMPSSPVTPTKPGEASTKTVFAYGMIWDNCGDLRKRDGF